VHLLGHVSYEDLPRWYSACDVFAMPNRDIGGDTEGFGLVYLEAAAAGKPAVAGRAGGTGSAVVDGVTGLRVDGAQLEQVARALARLLSSPEEAVRMGDNGRKRVLEYFTHERRVEQIRSLVMEKRSQKSQSKARSSQSPMA
jgi:phosphatidylinositol alpha-1,6-mannosyltransferase